jgi:hypothetical protein
VGIEEMFILICYHCVCLGDIDPYPNFDLSKIVRPGFENSEELKTFVVHFYRLIKFEINSSSADDVVKRTFTLEYATRVCY